jgi:hypothetical protein
MNTANNALENRIIQLEQHHRSWSARALNIPLSKEEETDNTAVANKVYNLLLLPILKGAVDKKLLQYIPTVDQLLETAHILPGKEGEPKPIIMRFYSRNIKEAIFKLKKFYAPREERASGGGAAGAARGGNDGTVGGAISWAGVAGGGERGEEVEPGGFEGRGRYCFPLYEDLTRATFLKLRALSKDSRVKSAWTVKGQIRFTLVKSPKDIRKVVSLLDPLDIILQ